MHCNHCCVRADHQPRSLECSETGDCVKQGSGSFEEQVDVVSGSHSSEFADEFRSGDSCGFAFEGVVDSAGPFPGVSADVEGHTLAAGKRPFDDGDFDAFTVWKFWVDHSAAVVELEGSGWGFAGSNVQVTEGFDAVANHEMLL